VLPERPPFECRMDEAKGAAAGILARMYEREASWKGKNNVTYRKKCTISPKDVRFTDARQAWLPVVSASVSFLSSEYGCEVVTDGERAVAFSDQRGKCSVYGSGISKKASCATRAGAYTAGEVSRGPRPQVRRVQKDRLQKLRVLGAQDADLQEDAVRAVRLWIQGARKLC